MSRRGCHGGGWPGHRLKASWRAWSREMEMIKVAGGSTGATAAHWRALCCSTQRARGFTEGIRRVRLGAPSSNRESLDSLGGLVTVWLLRIQRRRRRGPRGSMRRCDPKCRCRRRRAGEVPAAVASTGRTAGKRFLGEGAARRRLSGRARLDPGSPQLKTVWLSTPALWRSGPDGPRPRIRRRASASAPPCWEDSRSVDQGRRPSQNQAVPSACRCLSLLVGLRLAPHQSQPKRLGRKTGEVVFCQFADIAAVMPPVPCRCLSLPAAGPSACWGEGVGCTAESQDQIPLPPIRPGPSHTKPQKVGFAPEGS